METKRLELHKFPREKHHFQIPGQIEEEELVEIDAPALIMKTMCYFNHMT